MNQTASLIEILKEQADLLRLLESLLDEQRQALQARRPEQVENALVRLQTLALRFRILEDARLKLVSDMAPGEDSMEMIIERLENDDLHSAFTRMRRAAGRVVRAGAIHARFVQRSVETGEGLRRLFDWAAGGSYTQQGEVGAAPGPRSTWESCA